MPAWPAARQRPGMPKTSSARGAPGAKPSQLRPSHRMARILRRPLAGADIADIWGYIAENSALEADARIDRLDGKLRLLSSQPKMDRARDDLSPGVRSMSFGRYVIFYEPLPDDLRRSGRRTSAIARLPYRPYKLCA